MASSTVAGVSNWRAAFEGHPGLAVTPENYDLLMAAAGEPDPEPEPEAVAEPAPEPEPAPEEPAAEADPPESKKVSLT